MAGFYAAVDTMHVLSNEQVRMLSAFGVYEFCGEAGVATIQGILTKSDFDPATANNDVQKIVGAFDTANNRAESLIAAFQGIDLDLSGPDLGEGRALVRVEFRSDAAIQNVVDWKEWAATWHDIARGVAMAVGEAPEEVHVVGATRGSFILELGGSYLFVRLLTGMVKTVTGAAKEIVMLAHSVEDLRTKKLLNDQIEEAIRDQISAKEKSGVEATLAKMQEILPKKISGDKEGALKKSVEKLLKFHRLGGEVDFVEPPQSEEEEGNGSDERRVEIAALRNEIEALRVEKEELKRLTHEANE